MIKIKEPAKTEEQILTDNIPDHLDPNVKKYWLATNLSAVMILLFLFLLPMAMLALFIDGFAVFAIMSLVFAIMLTASAAVAIVLINATYDNITFLVSDELLTINRGILMKQSLAIPFARVQNVDIYRGPIERHFGIATIHVQTAGWGGGILGGRLQGIKNPELLRDVILKRVYRAKNNGL